MSVCNVFAFEQDTLDTIRLAIVIDYHNLLFIFSITAQPYIEHNITPLSLIEFNNQCKSFEHSKN